MTKNKIYSLIYHAYLLAIKAYKQNEIPIACLLTDLKGNIVAKSYNKTYKYNNPLFHCELIMCLNFTKKNKIKYLDKYILFINLEPCIMCSAALANLRINKIVFSCYNPKEGGLGGKINLLNILPEFKNTKILAGIMEKENSILLKNFFKNKR